MEINLTKRDGVWHPADEEAKELTASRKVSKIYKCKLTEFRNYPFHRKYFSLLQAGFANQDKYTVFEAFRREVSIRSGRYTIHNHVDGSTSLIADSISFGKMSQDGFEKLYRDSIQVIIDNFMVGCSEAEIMEMIRYD